MWIFGGKKVAQAQESPPDVGLDGSQRQAHVLGDLLVRKASEKRQRQQLPGQGIKRAQGRVQAMLTLHGGQQILRVAPALQVGQAFLVKWLDRITAPQGVEGATAGDGQDPGRDTATRGVEARCLSSDQPESIFGHLFGGLRMARDA